MTMMWRTLRAMTANSIAAEVPWCRPSSAAGGTRLAMLRWMKNSPPFAPKMDVARTLLSQHEITMEWGRWPCSASSSNSLRSRWNSPPCQAR